MITGRTRLYAIVGDPIGHVRTPMVFNASFAERGIDAVCLAIQIASDDLAEGWRGLRAMQNLDGFIVTSPHKAAAAGLCDRLDGDGQHVGIVNAVRREPGGSFAGTLLDGRGFVAGLRAQGHDPAGKRIHLSGAGGAGRALAFALAEAGAAAITIHNRTSARAESLAAAVRAAYPACRLEPGRADPSGHGIVVNATALGLAPHDPLPVDIQKADPSALVAEVIMMPRTTRLLEEAAARGHRIHHGTHMLDGQLDLMMAYFGLASQVATGEVAP